MPYSTETSTPQGAEVSGVRWFCVRTLPKHEHIAASQLLLAPEFEVFLPRIRYQKSTRSGSAWVTEALFPNYLFARFSLAACLRRIQSAHGVKEVVHFGSQWPAVPDEAVQVLRAEFGDAAVRVVTQQFTPGEAVDICRGALGGLKAVVSRVMPNQMRVAILLEFLGRQVNIDLPFDHVTPAAGFPQRAAFAC